MAIRDWLPGLDDDTDSEGTPFESDVGGFDFEGWLDEGGQRGPSEPPSEPRVVSESGSEESPADLLAAVASALPFSTATATDSGVEFQLESGGFDFETWLAEGDTGDETPGEAAVGATEASGPEPAAEPVIAGTAEGEAADETRAAGDAHATAGAAGTAGVAAGPSVDELLQFPTPSTPQTDTPAVKFAAFALFAVSAVAVVLTLIGAPGTLVSDGSTAVGAATETPTPSPTEAATASPTATATAAAAAAPTETDTATAPSTPTETDAASPTPTEADTASPTPTETATEEPIPDTPTVSTPTVSTPTVSTPTLSTPTLSTPTPPAGGADTSNSIGWSGDPLNTLAGLLRLLPLLAGAALGARQVGR